MSQNRSVELSAFSFQLVTETGRNLIYCQAGRKIASAAAAGEREREHEQYYLIVYKMMEAMTRREREEGGKHSLPTDCASIVISNGREREDDSIRPREKRIEQAQSHTWTNEETRAN